MGSWIKKADGNYFIVPGGVVVGTDGVTFVVPVFDVKVPDEIRGKAVRVTVEIIQ